MKLRLINSILYNKNELMNRNAKLHEQKYKK